jgi:hypothetical protein
MDDLVWALVTGKDAGLNVGHACAQHFKVYILARCVMRGGALTHLKDRRIRKNLRGGLYLSAETAGPFTAQIEPFTLLILTAPEIEGLRAHLRRSCLSTIIF